ncbi:MAG: C4-dicarboxylate TRAP transporter substrate-binding protein [Pseudomonadota bacterium]
MLRKTTAMAAALAMTAAAGAAEARELSYAHYISSVHVVNTKGMTPFFERLSDKTGGEITYESFWGGAMGGPKELLGAVEDNIVDSAGIVDVYLKRALPHSALISSLFVVADDVKAFAAAVNEYQLLHCPGCVEDYHDSNAVPLAWYSTSPYVLMCTSPVSTLDDLAGKKVRATSRMGVLMEKMGATPVSITSAEMYEAMQRGQADCSVGAAAWLTGYNIKDFVATVMADPLGAYIGSGLMNMNMDTWEELSVEHRQAIIDELPQLVADVMWAYLEEADNAVQIAQEEHGAELVEAGPEFKAQLEEIRATEWDEAIAQGEEDGVENARQVVEEFREIADKWRGIVAKIGDDKAAYAEALDREIFSKLEP